MSLGGQTDGAELPNVRDPHGRKSVRSRNLRAPLCHGPCLLRPAGALVAGGDTDFAIVVTGPGVNGSLELMEEDAELRRQWVVRLRQAAGRAVVVVQEVQAWVLLRGWSPWYEAEGGGGCLGG